MFLAYEDIFAQNAFGNFKDLLRDVSYSPMMGEMLSFHDSASALYALQREGRVSRPDENFAREIMQLFTIGESSFNFFVSSGFQGNVHAAFHQVCMN